MKSERRHELQQNDLAKNLEGYWDQVKPYASWIVGGVVVGVLIAMVISFQRGESREERDAMWDEYYAAESTDDVEKLRELAAKHADRPLGEIATLTLADMSMAQGAQQDRAKRSEAQTKFDEAAKNYQSVAESTDDPMLKNRALYGQAQALEWMMQLEKAKEVYEQVEGPLAIQAEQRVAALNQPSTDKFYEMYAAYTPKAAIDPAQLSPNFDFSEEGEESDFDLLRPLDPGNLDETDGAEGEGADSPLGDLLPDLGLSDEELGGGSTEPTGDDTTEPTGDDTTEPTGEDTAEPTGEDAAVPTGDDTTEPTGDDTAEPTGDDTAEPIGDDATEPTGDATEAGQEEGVGEESTVDEATPPAE